MMTEQSIFADFEPQKPIHSPNVLVTPIDSPNDEPLPLHYWLNGFQRHHEKLTAMAGNVKEN
jgi:hypothetical protein